jgi:MFS family permease
MTVLKHRDFRLVWTGQVVSVVGDGMRTLALLWWVKIHGGSNAGVVAVAAAAAVPVVVASPLGGWVADRYDRRRSMIGADLLRAGASAGIAALLFTGHLTTLLLCTFVTLSGLGTAWFDPSFAAAVPSLVPPEDRAGANGLNLANSAGGGLLGPLVGGLLLTVVAPGWVLVIDVASFLWSAALISRARIAHPSTFARLASDPAGGLATAEPPASVRTVLADAVTRRLVSLACLLNFIAAPMTVLLVALAVDRHHVGPRLYAVLDMTIPAGLLVGAVLAAKAARHRLALLASLLATGSTLALVGMAPLAVAIGLLVVCGGSLAVANTVLVTILQSAVPAEVQGRAFGVLGSLAQALRPCGLLLAAPLLGLAGVPGSFAVVGLAVVAATLVWGRPSALARPVEVPILSMGPAAEMATR